MATKRKKSSAKKKKSGLTSDIYTLISYSYAGKLISALIISALVLLTSMIISRNDYDLFFRLNGIAVLVITIISWIIFLIKR